MINKEIKTKEEKLSYALGMSIASNLINSGVRSLNIDIFAKALKDLFGGQQPAITPDEANQILENFMNGSSGNDAEKNLQDGLTFLAENSMRDGVVQLESGLQYQILAEGAGRKPGIKDKVKCHYHGTLIDGTVFDSSVQRGKPAEFPVSGVIGGWVEALQLMPVGSKYRLFIPPDLAYGSRGAGGTIGPNSTLIFDVELLEIV
ncbi:FKBP-type peptidyl-prolyl cis-trans isomerase [Bacteroidales bacterium 6E]|nr:FKBP-type peptidyl-prolyl cis-trans isomerase [Bacteroidales bacterium 6E]